MKLALGTVQFGLKYGIANQQDRVSFDQASLIVRQARSGGMDLLDTAMAYGDSEQRLGEIGVTDWRVVSKLNAVPADEIDPAASITAAVRGCVSRLGVTRLYGLLLHRPAQLLEARGPRLFEVLQALKTDGLVEKIGVSIYDATELDELCSRFDLDLVQAPFNLLDRRLIDTGWLARLSSQGIELHVRSVFLQGLLLMRRDRRPSSFSRWNPLWAAYDEWLDQSHLTPLQAGIRWALSFSEISQVIVGVDSAAHLTEIFEAAEGPAPAVPAWIRSDDSTLLNPSQWPA